jgi:hypothetical protein
MTPAVGWQPILTQIYWHQACTRDLRRYTSHNRANARWSIRPDYNPEIPRDGNVLADVTSDSMPRLQ